MGLRQAGGVAALAWALPAACLAAGPDIRLGETFAATDPGTDGFAAALARVDGLRGGGVPAFGDAVVTTEADDTAAWITGTDRTEKLAPGRGQLELTADSAGFAAGIDRRVGENAVLGVSVNQASTGWRAGRLTGNASSAGAGIYGAATWPGVLFAAAAVQYDFDDAASGSRSTSPGTVRAGGTVGHFIDLSGFTFTPLAEIEYGSTSEPNAAPAQETLTLRSGLRVNSAFYRWGVLGSPYISLLWERRVEAADAQGTLAQPGSDGVVSGGVVLSLPHGVFAGFDAGTSFSGRLDERTARLSLTLGF